MNSFSVGDLAHTYTLQRRSAALKTQMSHLGNELSTGQISDKRAVFSANIDHIMDIEADLKALEGYKVAVTEATQFSQAVQIALERVDTSVGNLATTLFAMSPHATEPVMEQFSAEAEAELTTIVSALNTKLGGRFLFSGKATDRPALADVSNILDGLRDAVVGATTIEEISTRANAWFNSTSGFTSAVYSGDISELSGFRLSKGEVVHVQTTANSQVFRDTIKHIAIAAISSDPALGLDINDQRTLMQDAGKRLFDSRTDLTALRGTIGSAQSRIDVVSTRNSNKESALMMTKAALLSADPFEAATKLEAVQFQLQSLYTVTAKMAEMSFLNYMR